MVTQPKITSFFFKPTTVSPPNESTGSSPSSTDSAVSDPNSHKSTPEPEITITYERKNRNIHMRNRCETTIQVPKLEQFKSGKVLNQKKRNYAQLHLEVGQSDFLLRTCSLCGFRYTAGDEGDERVHKTFHKNYTHGVPFKGWRNERIVDALEGGHIVLLQDGDTFSHQNKVHDVVRVMEIELGEGWILIENCKVYLFISSQRVAGCLVVVPIKEAFRIRPSSVDEKSTNMPAREKTKMATALPFGNVSFQRESIRKDFVDSSKDVVHNGAIVCENEALPAICGVRAIWVSPYNRRKHIASHLLDAARKSFCTGLHLDHTQLAFSTPTSLGRALIPSYTRTNGFLIYKVTSTRLQF